MRSFEPGAERRGGQELLDGTTHPRLVFGHTHVQFRRPAAVGDVELVNPGSVGVPLDGDPRAAYALIDPDSRELELRRVEYDTAGDDRRAARDATATASGRRTILRRLETQQPWPRFGHRAGAPVVAAGLDVAQPAQPPRRRAVARQAGRAASRAAR